MRSGKIQQGIHVVNVLHLVFVRQMLAVHVNKISHL